MDPSGAGSPARWLLLRAALIGVLSCGEARAPSTHSAPTRQVAAWVLGDDVSVESMRQNLDALTVVSPTFYKVAVVGKTTRLVPWEATPTPRARFQALASGKRVSVLPMVGCVEQCAENLSAILDDERARAAHVAALLAAAEADGLDGLFIDYEEIRCSTDGFSRFIDALAGALHGRGKKLGIAVAEPCGIAPDCEREPYPFALNHLAATADVLAVMEYDFIVDGSGPIAPSDWLVRGLRRLQRDIESRNMPKVFVGIPLYGRVSRDVTTSDNAVLWADVTRRIAGAPLLSEPLRFDAGGLAKVARVSNAKSGREGKIFLEDHDTLTARLEILEREGFANIALWRLGGEDPCVWPVIRAWRRNASPRASRCE